MTAEKTTMAFGRYVYGLGVMALATGGLAWGVFDPGQPVPEHFPHRIALAYAAAAFLFVAAAAVAWRRTAAWGAAALTAYFTLFVVVLMNGRLLLTHYAEYVTYENIAMQLALAAAGLIIYSTCADINPALASRLTRLGQITFGVCALVFGGAHFAYAKYTAMLVPKWLPPTQLFWTYATAIGFLAAGVAIVTRIRARLAAILLTAMLASFTLLVHIPALMADHASHFNWTELAINLADLGAAWVVADSLAS